MSILLTPAHVAQKPFWYGAALGAIQCGRKVFRYSDQGVAPPLSIATIDTNTATMRVGTATSFANVKPRAMWVERVNNTTVVYFSHFKQAAHAQATPELLIRDLNIGGAGQFSLNPQLPYADNLEQFSRYLKQVNKAYVFKPMVTRQMVVGEAGIGLTNDTTTANYMFGSLAGVPDGNSSWMPMSMARLGGQLDFLSPGYYAAFTAIRQGVGQLRIAHGAGGGTSSNAPISVSQGTPGIGANAPTFIGPNYSPTVESVRAPEVRSFFGLTQVAGAATTIAYPLLGTPALVTSTYITGIHRCVDAMVLGDPATRTATFVSGHATKADILALLADQIARTSGSTQSQITAARASFNASFPAKGVIRWLLSDQPMSPPDIYSSSGITRALEEGASQGDIDEYVVNGITLAARRATVAGMAPRRLIWWQSDKNAGFGTISVNIVRTGTAPFFSISGAGPQPDENFTLSAAAVAACAVAPALVPSAVAASIETSSGGHWIGDPTNLMRAFTAEQDSFLYPWVGTGYVDAWYKYSFMTSLEPIVNAFVDGMAEPLGHFENLP